MIGQNLQWWFCRKAAKEVERLGKKKGRGKQPAKSASRVLEKQYGSRQVPGKDEGKAKSEGRVHKEDPYMSRNIAANKNCREVLRSFRFIVSTYCYASFFFFLHILSHVILTLAFWVGVTHSILQINRTWGKLRQIAHKHYLRDQCWIGFRSTCTCPPSASQGITGLCRVTQRINGGSGL